MRFLVRKRRTAPTVIIVALIDVLIVLLIFLMVTTTFKQQPSLRLALPESNQKNKAGADEKPPLIVSIDKDGGLRLGQEELPVTIDQLKGQLLARTAKDPDLKLAVNADKNAPWYRIVNVMDIAKEANIKALSAFTKDAHKP